MDVITDYNQWFESNSIYYESHKGDTKIYSSVRDSMMGFSISRLRYLAPTYKLLNLVMVKYFFPCNRIISLDVNLE